MLFSDTLGKAMNEYIYLSDISSLSTSSSHQRVSSLSLFGISYSLVESHSLINITLVHKRIDAVNRLFPLQANAISHLHSHYKNEVLHRHRRYFLSRFERNSFRH
jgi:hypothetical protein